MSDADSDVFCIVFFSFSVLVTASMLYGLFLLVTCCLFFYGFLNISSKVYSFVTGSDSIALIGPEWALMQPYPHKLS